MAKNIFTLKKNLVLDFFMKSSQYHSFELPEYLDFDPLLQKVKRTIGNRRYADCIVEAPENCEAVNLSIPLSKDGKYGLRPLNLANPFLYYFLAREIAEGWIVIKQCFARFAVPHITSCALPVIPEKVEPFHKATTILNWWSSMEQRSIELALDYRYMFVTDITNCYGSINPQSLDWAIAMRGTRFAKADNSDLASSIRRFVCAMQGGRNVGIPQGSTLFDFIGEIVLGYSDLLLHEALEKEEITDGYEILRFRDDYRIFSNDRDQLERISYILQEVLERLNFKMNTSKTKVSDSLILDSIKSDKLDYIAGTPIFNKKGCDFDSFEKHLLFIYLFGHKHPNSGQLKTLLSDLSRRIAEWTKPFEAELQGEDVDLGLQPEQIEEKNIFKKLMIQKRLIGGEPKALISIATRIGMENVSAVHYALRIISQILSTIKDKKQRIQVAGKVRETFMSLPNRDYVEIWLQNLTLSYDSGKGYSNPICQLVSGEAANLWNDSWLKEDIIKSVDINKAIDSRTLKCLSPVLTFREARAYDALQEVNPTSHVAANVYDDDEEFPVIAEF